MIQETRPAYTLDQWFDSDIQLHHIYPEPIRLLAKKHWTPIGITRVVAKFLVTRKGSKVLDIGSGVGKFCLAGAYYKPEAHFFGVEQREHLVVHAIEAKKMLRLENVSFIHQNLTDLDFKEFDHFYFFNSFYENLNDTEKIDDTIDCSPNLYTYYTRQLYKKLEAMPIGTRLATYHSMEDKVPRSYYLVEQHVGSLLKFWIKK